MDEHSSIRQLKRVLLRLYFSQSPEMDRLAVTLSRLDKLPDKIAAYIEQIEAELIHLNEANIYGYQETVRRLNEHINSLGEERLFTIPEKDFFPPPPRDVSLSEINLAIPGIASSSIPSTAPSLCNEPPNKTQDTVNRKGASVSKDIVSNCHLPFLCLRLPRVSSVTDTDGPASQVNALDSRAFDAIARGELSHFI